MWNVVQPLACRTTEGREELVETPPSLPCREVLGRFWPYARPLRWWLVLSIALGSTGSLVEGGGVWLSKVVIDRADIHDAQLLAGHR